MKDTEKKDAIADETITIYDLQKTYTGYTYEGGQGKTKGLTNPDGDFESTTTVLEDGTRNVNLYYVKGKDPKITLKVDPNGGTYEGNPENTIYS